MSWTVGVDVGGTFTDFFAVDQASGRHVVAKFPSTPDNPARAIIDGLRRLHERHQIAPGAIERLSHGTTVGTNALIQRRGARVVLVTTRGFRDLLEIGRQTRPHMFDLVADHPAPLVPRERRLEVDERLDAEGQVVRALDADAIARAVAEVLACGAQACAVGFLFSFRNAAHEQSLAAALHDAAPHLPVSVSSAVQPEFREYERFSTTVLNAYLQPLMHEYLSTLETEVLSLTSDVHIGINQSSGGLMSPARARDFPVRTALSGPAAGAVGAAHIARQHQRDRIITLDMGGTSADVALIRDYQADVAFERDVAGFPIRLPCVDIETVGAGGGSIAWFDRDGLMKVGPDSAGAVPGPACYGLGGTAPTVTDANLLLGRLSARGLLDGEMALDQSLARAAFAPLAEQLGYSAERAAHGVLGIVVANMVRTIRTISVERGHDPREFVLMPFGGAGPLHAREVALELGIGEMLVPAAPGIVCAQGLVVSDLQEDFVASSRLDVADASISALAASRESLIERATRWFEAERIPAAARVLHFSVDARYVGQNFELPVAIGQYTPGKVDALPTPQALHARFCAAHEMAYGYASEDDPVEIVNVRLSARARQYRADEVASAAGRPAALPAPHATRPVFFAADHAVDTPIYLRESLSPGQQIHGPAIIEQLDTTTPIHPGDAALVSASGDLLITLNLHSRPAA